MNYAANHIDEEAWHPSVDEQLHQIAERALKRESPGHSLQPTLLVNDAYLRLLEQRNTSADDRSAELGVGAMIIRRLLVDCARKQKSQKRGGEEEGRGKGLHVSIADDASQIDVPELNDALEVLGERRPRAARVVELKFFGGQSSEEISDQLGVSLRTVKSDWRFAKAWLYRELGSDQGYSET